VLSQYETAVPRHIIGNLSGTIFANTNASTIEMEISMHFGKHVGILGVTVALFATPALADIGNYNPNAGGNGNGNGAANANCNSALILFCDGGSGSVSGAPSPALGIAGLLAVAGAGFAARWLAKKKR